MIPDKETKTPDILDQDISDIIDQYTITNSDTGMAITICKTPMIKAIKELFERLKITGNADNN